MNTNRWRFAALFGLMAAGAVAAQVAVAQGGYKAAEVKATLPEGVKASLKPLVQAYTAVRLTDADGKPVATIWRAQAVVATKVPVTQGPGVVLGQIPQGAFMGVIQLHRDATDAKEQPAKAGVYVMRYLHQPDDGNHLGTTDFADFAVLFSMKVDPGTPVAKRDDLIDAALASIGHPRVFSFQPAGKDQKTPGLGKDSQGHLVLFTTMTAKTKAGQTGAFKFGLLPGLIRAK